MAEGAGEHLVFKVRGCGEGGGEGFLGEGVVGGEGEDGNATAVCREVGLGRPAEDDVRMSVGEDVGGDAVRGEVGFGKDEQDSLMVAGKGQEGCPLLGGKAVDVNIREPIKIPTWQILPSSFFLFLLPFSLKL